VLGFLTPIAAFAVTSAMLVAIAMVHWQKGFWNGNGGFEFNLLIAAAASALAATGGERFSVDNALGWADNLSGVWWGVGSLVGGALAALMLLTLGRRPEAPAERDVRRGETLRAA
jgi:putative oxidoreductase